MMNVNTICQFEVFYVRVHTEGSSLPASTHGAQTKQEQESFLNPTWHRRNLTYQCGFMDRPGEWHTGEEIQRNEERRQEEMLGLVCLFRV